MHSQTPCIKTQSRLGVESPIVASRVTEELAQVGDKRRSMAQHVCITLESLLQTFYMFFLFVSQMIILFPLSLSGYL